jgi:hypothetical protein
VTTLVGPGSTGPGMKFLPDKLESCASKSGRLMGAQSGLGPLSNCCSVRRGSAIDAERNSLGIAESGAPNGEAPFNFDTDFDAGTASKHCVGATGAAKKTRTAHNAHGV